MSRRYSALRPPIQEQTAEHNTVSRLLPPAPNVLVVTTISILIATTLSQDSPLFVLCLQVYIYTRYARSRSRHKLACGKHRYFWLFCTFSSPSLTVKMTVKVFYRKTYPLVMQVRKSLKLLTLKQRIFVVMSRWRLGWGIEGALHLSTWTVWAQSEDWWCHSLSLCWTIARWHYFWKKVKL